MLVVEVYVIRSEPFQTGVTNSAPVFRRPIDAGDPL